MLTKFRNGWTKWLIVCATSFVLGACLMGDDVDWTRVSSTFMKTDGPYGPGSFRIRGNSVISMKTADAETKLESMTDAQAADPDYVPQYTEEWMSDPYERSIRGTVRILTGPINGPMTIQFKERAQLATWWLSPDWKTIYLATGWSDVTQEKPPGKRYWPVTTKLYKSTDGGHTWQRLDWPEDQHITFLHFLDAKRGYAIGWGPHIWRTDDGGQHWTKVPVPHLARNPDDPRQRFDTVGIRADGTLRFAFFTKRYRIPGTKQTLENVSLVSTLKFGQDNPELAFTILEYTITNLLAAEDGTVYILARKGPPIDYSDPGDINRKRPSVVFRWRNGTLEKLHEFKPGLVFYALYFTPSGRLMAAGLDQIGMGTEGAVALRNGDEWDIQYEGNAQGGYYDADTGTQWLVRGYTLYKRHIP